MSSTYRVGGTGIDPVCKVDKSIIENFLESGKGGTPTPTRAEVITTKLDENLLRILKTRVGCR